ncbi:bud site selection protein 16 [Dacryopinax primogenitus]|uniref:pyridoxal kinase n=1 Tax=Dacryopinax primogenitus (strain DJM 731) TaxID=1858805 RepID=M5GCF7_DACPD|nr:bud site selection protein 16 [Dacryopinax primogenitus]EJU03862.1 bud site selection protein 16 [Dacryopinax primogenitus]
MDDHTRVLSIQSHVCSGYVGNRAATFPLQLLGYDVDVINTVQFSNHSGYGRLKGTRTDADQLANILHGLEENGLLRPGRLLTGYVPGAAALMVVAELARKLRDRNPELIYLLDPVMGDDNKIYVAPECIPIYKDLLDCATIITPNWFEAELLTGVKLESESTLREALRILHTLHGVPHVVISTVLPTPELAASLPAHVLAPQTNGLPEHSPYLGDVQLVVSSSVLPEDERKDGKVSTVHVGSVKQIKGYFSGVGDLFSALVLAHFPGRSDPPPPAPDTPLSRATARAVASVQGIIVSTHHYVQTLPEEERPETDQELDGQDGERRVRRMRARELRLIQGREYILNPDERGKMGGRMVPWTDFWEL